MSYFANCLQRLLDETDMRQRDLAKKSGLYDSQISRWLKGEVLEISRPDVERVLNAFGKDPKTGKPTPERQARLVAARCLDAKHGPGSEWVRVSIENPTASTGKEPLIAREEEEALRFIHAALIQNKEYGKFVIQLATLMGKK